MKFNLLIYTYPYSDGLGDTFSAIRVYKLLKQQYPDANIQLYIETVSDQELKERMQRPITQEELSISHRNNDLSIQYSTLTQHDLQSNPPSLVLCVAGYQEKQDHSDEPAIRAFFNGKYCSASPLAREKFFYRPEYCKLNKDNFAIMNVPQCELDLVTNITDLESYQKLPEDIKLFINSNNYFFAYARPETRINYIKALADKYAKSHPLIIIAPGSSVSLPEDLKHMIFNLNTSQYEYSNCSEDVRPDVILLTGKLEHGEFMTWLINCGQHHVLVTGDMSLTEALHFRKLPFNDIHHADSFFSRALYGSYSQWFVGQKSVKDFLEVFSNLENPEIYKEVSKDIKTNYINNVSMARLLGPLYSLLSSMTKSPKPPPIDEPPKKRRPLY